MRMPADELGRDRLDHIAEIEGALLFFHAGLEHDLQQEVPELFLEIGKIVARDGVSNLVGFLERVGRNRREILLQVPRATALGSPQRGHDLDEPADVARRGHAGTPKAVPHSLLSSAAKAKQGARYSTSLSKFCCMVARALSCIGTNVADGTSFGAESGGG